MFIGLVFPFKKVRLKSFLLSPYWSLPPSPLNYFEVFCNRDFPVVIFLFHINFVLIF